MKCSGIQGWRIAAVSDFERCPTFGLCFSTNDKSPSATTAPCIEESSTRTMLRSVVERESSPESGRPITDKVLLVLHHAVYGHLFRVKEGATMFLRKILQPL